MSRAGHSTLAFAAAAVIISAQPTIHGATFALGVLAAASLPDDCEIPVGDMRTVIPHRTWTHWPWPWFALMLLAFMYLQWPIGTLVAGAAFGAIFHLLVDAFSPGGIPLLHPNRKQQNRYWLYKSREATEWRLILPALLLTSVVVATSWPHLVALGEGLARAFLGGSLRLPRF